MLARKEGFEPYGRCKWQVLKCRQMRSFQGFPSEPLIPLTRHLWSTSWSKRGAIRRYKAPKGKSLHFGSTPPSLPESIYDMCAKVKRIAESGYLKSDVGFFCFRVFEKGGCSKVLCGVFSFRAVRGKAVAVKFYVGFPIRSDLCRKRHRHLTEDADAFLLECSGNQLNNSSSFCWSVPSLAYGSASNCRKLCLMSFVSSLKPRMYESAM